MPPCLTAKNGQWSGNGSDTAPTLQNRTACYSIPVSAKEAFDVELQLWIDEGILVPVPHEERVDSVVPLMAVEQSTKGKTRPVLDFRELNQFVSSHSGDSVVCDETLRRWRLSGQNVSIIDLRKAYLQLHVDPKLWRYQAVCYKEKYYYLTRLGFGLNCAPHDYLSYWQRF